MEVGGVIRYNRTGRVQDGLWSRGVRTETNILYKFAEYWFLSDELATVLGNTL